MRRFLAFVWNTSNAKQCAAVSRLCRTAQLKMGCWDTVSNLNGLRVFCPEGANNPYHVHPVLADAGVVVGSVFQRNMDPLNAEPSRYATFDQRESERVLASAGRRLIDAYWGWYVAFLFDPQAKKTSIVRSPICDFRCLYSVVEGAHVFFSRLEDFAALRCAPLTIDWEALAAQIAFGASLRVRESALREVVPLGRGECLAIGPDSVKKLVYWSPADVARSAPIGDFEQAAIALRSTVHACVHTWAGGHQRALVRLSGGVDSSIVLTCLRSAPNGLRTMCLNEYSNGPMGDERTFARCAAAHVNAPLVERERNPTISLRIVETITPAAAPPLDIRGSDLHAFENALCRSHDLSAIFTGAQGDALFERNADLTPAADHLFRHGITRDFIRVLFDLAMHRRVSIWRILPTALQMGWWSPPTGTWNDLDFIRIASNFDPTGLLPAAAAKHLVTRLEDYAHPWLRQVDGVPPGKLLQISRLTAEDYFDAPFRTPSDPIIIAPFMSQPLVELCLRIPTYLNIARGWDRAVARHAFRSDLPQMILNRTSKGGPTFWLRQVLDANSAFVNEFLRDGVLARHGLFDVSKLDEVAPGAPSRNPAAGGLMLNVVYTEAWARAIGRLQCEFKSA